KRRIVEALRDPRGVAQDAQRPERLDQAQRAAIERAQRLVAVGGGLALAQRLGVAAGREQPQILHRGPGEKVVEVEEERPLRAPQQVAEVAVAVQPDRLAAETLERRAALGDELVAGRDEARAQLLGQKFSAGQ